MFIQTYMFIREMRVLGNKGIQRTFRLYLLSLFNEISMVIGDHIQTIETLAGSMYVLGHELIDFLALIYGGPLLSSMV